MMTEFEIWLEAFKARATVVIQQRCLVYDAEQCAKFADDAVTEAKKRKILYSP